MSKNIKISASILNSNFAYLADEIKKVEKAGVDMLHVDIMDGVFVPNITIGPPVIKCIRDNTRLFLDVHLMITRPDRLLDSFIESGADSINVHVEECLHLDRTLNYIKEAGKKTAIALNPSTPVSTVENVLGLVDMILIMTVNPGYGGQGFIGDMVYKIQKLKNLIEDYKRQTGRHDRVIDIQVDGGINLDTASKVVSAGATVLSVGTSIFRADDPVAFVKKLRESLVTTL
ncbi:MAG: ribulose-phosphate 3-epimerase [Actinomycetia bacterium]|nr:ribulose-phosphate 3-epimerase [Actinomycetes bacterium]